MIIEMYLPFCRLNCDWKVTKWRLSVITEWWHFVLCKIICFRTAWSTMPWLFLYKHCCTVYTKMCFFRWLLVLKIETVLYCVSIKLDKYVNEPSSGTSNWYLIKYVTLALQTKSSQECLYTVHFFGIYFFWAWLFSYPLHIGTNELQ